MKTGLPCQATVRRWPTCTGARSTSVVDNAKVSAAGLRLSMNGQIVTAAPTPATALAVSIRKSRREPPSGRCACAVSAIRNLLQSAADVMVAAGRTGRNRRVRPTALTGSYTLEEAELCDRLPHKTTISLV